MVDRTLSVDFEPRCVGGVVEGAGWQGWVLVSRSHGETGAVWSSNLTPDSAPTTPSSSHPWRRRRAPAPPPAAGRQWPRWSGKSRTLGSRAWACRQGWPRRRWSRSWWPGATGRGSRRPAWFWNRWQPGWWGRFPPCSAGSATWWRWWGWWGTVRNGEWLSAENAALSDMFASQSALGVKGSSEQRINHFICFHESQYWLDHRLSSYRLLISILPNGGCSAASKIKRKIRLNII